MNNETRHFNIKWEPQEQQLVCLNACGISAPFAPSLTFRPSGSKGEPFQKSVPDVIGYGGAAGGGKTDTLLSIAIVAAFAYPRINIGFFRREFPQLEGVGGAIQRSLSLLTGVAKYNDHTHKWTFPTRSILQFCHCQHAKDVYNYQSMQFDIELIDEATQFTAEMIDYLITRNRATVDYPTFKPFTAMATNPGGIGHKFFKERFVTLGEPNKVHEYTYETGQRRKHIFIPSRLEDNQILLKRDPTYPERLSTNPTIQRMLREGDWDILSGQYFDMWRYDLHTIRPFIPLHKLTKYAGIDWGREQPFCFLAGALEKVYLVDYKPFYRLWIYHEEYGRHKAPEEWARIIKRRVNLVEFDKILVDPSSFARDNIVDTTSIAREIMETFGDEGYKVVKANNDRINGWNQVLNWLRIAPDGKPYLRVTQDCINLIRTIPEMLHDERNPEDINTQLEDHACDCLRYMLTGITWVDAYVGRAVEGNRTPRIPYFPPQEHAMDLSQFETAQELSHKTTVRSTTQ